MFDAKCILNLQDHFNLISFNTKIDKLLRPERFDLLLNSENAAKLWSHLLKTFENYFRTRH